MGFGSRDCWDRDKISGTVPGFLPFFNKNPWDWQSRPVSIPEFNAYLNIVIDGFEVLESSKNFQEFRQIGKSFKSNWRFVSWISTDKKASSSRIFFHLQRFFYFRNQLRTRLWNISNQNFIPYKKLNFCLLRIIWICL